MTALLEPNTPRIQSYLWLTHLAHHQHLAFVVNELLHLQRACKIAQCNGDVDLAVEDLNSDTGKQRIKKHYNSFVERFMSNYGLPRTEAESVALAYGKMTGFFLEKLEGSKDGHIHDQLNQFTKPKETLELKSYKKCCNGWPPELVEQLLNFHRRGILVFDRKKQLMIGHRSALQRMDKLFNQAAAYIRSSNEIRKLRMQRIARWEEEREQFLITNADWYVQRYQKVFHVYEEERTAQHQANLDTTHPGCKCQTFRIGGANIKGFKRVVRAWHDAGLWGDDATATEDKQRIINHRLELLQQVRDVDNERFGDIHVFTWLAEHASDWPGFAKDFETLLNYNKNHIQCPKPIGYSQPDALKHPYWYEVEEQNEKKKSNMEKGYVPHLDEHFLELTLVVPAEDTCRKDSNKPNSTLIWDSTSIDKPSLTDGQISTILAGLRENAALVSVPVRFTPDTRMLNRVSKNPNGPVEWNKKKYSFLYADPEYGQLLPFRPAGMKLVFSPRPVRHGKSRVYAYFSTSTLVPKREAISVKSGISRLPPGTRIMAVDLGYRHSAFAVIREYDGDDPNGNHIWAGSLKPGGGRHSNRVTMLERRMSAKRSQAMKRKEALGRAPKMHNKRSKTAFAADLRDHITNLKDDIAKQTAARILQTAVEYGVRIIVLEQLDLRPNAERSRRENRLVSTMALRNLLQQVGQAMTSGRNYSGVDRARYYSIHTRTVNPAYTSQTCHLCGSPGIRFNELTERFFRDKAGNPTPARKLHGKMIGREMIGAAIPSQGGKLFCCSNPECRIHKINADYNAAHNIYRKFAKLDMISPPSEKQPKKRREYWANTEQDCLKKMKTKGMRLAGEP